MKYILAHIVAKHLENGFHCEVSYKEVGTEITKNREFILTDIDKLPSFLHLIEEDKPLP